MSNVKINVFTTVQNTMEKKNQYQFKCTLYLEPFHHLTLPSDGFFQQETALIQAKCRSLQSHQTTFQKQ